MRCVDGRERGWIDWMGMVVLLSYYHNAWNLLSRNSFLYVLQDVQVVTVYESRRHAQTPGSSTLDKKYTSA